jgi:predicted nucleic acid-binding protein
MKNPVHIPSDHLAGLREIIFSLPTLVGTLDGLQQIRLVVDSNCVIDDLIWLSRTRTNPSAKTSLLEVIESGTVIAYAPVQLHEQVEKHLAEIAAEENIPEDRLYAEWKSYQQALKFCEASSPQFHIPNSDRDPSDLPFICLCAQVGALAIVSRDKDLPAMGACTISVEVLLDLRNYARARTIELSLSVDGQFFITAITMGIFQLTTQLVRTLAQVFARLPVGLQLVLGIGAFVALCHPRSRQAIVDGFRALSKKISPATTALRPVLQEAIQCYGQQRARAVESWAKVESALHTPSKAPLRVCAYAACVAERRPLSLYEIERKVRLGGYRSKAQDFISYLRKVMLNDSRFLRCPNRRWTVATVSQN